MEWNIQALNPGMVNELLLFNSIRGIMSSHSHKYTSFRVSQLIPLKEIILFCVLRSGVYVQEKCLSLSSVHSVHTRFYGQPSLLLNAPRDFFRLG